MVMLLKVFNCDLMFCGNNALEPKTIYLSMAYYVHVTSIQRSKIDVYLLTFRNFS
jgi:hypothetical protein